MDADGRLLKACRRDDRNNPRHCGTFLAAIQKGFVVIIFTLYSH